jgi:hypothetical protein
LQHTAAAEPIFSIVIDLGPDRYNSLMVTVVHGDPPSWLFDQWPVNHMIGFSPMPAPRHFAAADLIQPGGLR